LRGGSTAKPTLVLLTALVALATSLGAVGEGTLIRASPGAGVPVSSAAMLLSGLTSDGLGIRLAAFPLPATDGLAPVLVLVDVALADGQGPRLSARRFKIVVYATKGDLDVAAVASHSLTVEPTSTPDRLQSALRLDLRAGFYDLRVLVTDEDSNRVGLKEVALDLEGYGQAMAWWPRSQVAVLATEGDALIDAVMSVGADAPRALTAGKGRLRPGERVLVGLVLREPDGQSRAVDANVRSLDEEETQTFVAHVAARARRAEGVSVYSILLDVPDLPPGEYGLRLEGRRDDGSGFQTDEISFQVVADSGMIVAATSGVVVESDSPTTAEPGTRKLSPRYLEVLMPLSEGDMDEAFSRARRLEKETFDQRRAGGLRRLARAQEAIVARLGRDTPEALSALILLHARLHEAYASEGHAVLAAFSMQRLLRLADEVEHRVKEPRSRRHASAALCWAGSILQKNQWLEASDRAFATAISLDRSLPAALLGAAGNREKNEGYPAAVGLLRDLVEVAPSHEEGRLRLAVNLVRVGRVDDAVSSLRGLSRDATREWISVVAYQELARLESEEDPRQALATLAEGRQRWPDDPGLAALAALYRDRANPRAPTASILQPLLDSTYDEATPRHRYNLWPDLEGLDLDAVYEVGRKPLVQWLAEAEGR